MTSKATPVGEGNAIDSIAFVLQFLRPFSDTEVNALLSLEAALAGDFPRFDTTKSVSMTLPAAGEQAQPSEVRVSGVKLQRFLATGKPEWMLHVHENQIVASCLRYTKWKEVWPRSRSWLSKAVDTVSCDDNPITAVAMQVIDRFEQQAPSAQNYDLEDVFWKDSPYLTRNVASAGAQWHVFQGWFDTFELSNDQSCRILNVINLSCSQQGTKLHSVIDHTLQMQLGANPLPAVPASILGSDGGGGEGVIERAFEKLHDFNKTILRNTLSKRQLKAIELEGGNQ